MRCKSTEIVEGSACDVNLVIPYKLCDLATWTKGQVTSGAKVGKRIIIAILYCLFFWEFKYIIPGTRINPLSFITAAYNSNAPKESLDIHNRNSNKNQEDFISKAT